MTTKFEISKEQLESLVTISEFKDAATIIAREVTRHHVIPQEPPLPHNPEHRNDGNGLPGLKRIYRWLNWEMSADDFLHHHDSRMSHIYQHIEDEIKLREPNANFGDTRDW